MSAGVGALGTQATAAGLLWGLAVLLVLGDALRRILGSRRLVLPKSGAEELGMRILLGLATVPWVVMLLDLTSVSITRISLSLLASVAGAIGLVVARPRPGFRPRGRPRLFRSPGAAILTLAAASLPILSFIYVSYFGPWAYDALVGYDLVGKMIAVEGKLVSSVFREIDFNAQCVYAPFTAANQGFWYLFYPAAPKLWVPLLAGGFSLCFWSIVRRWTDSPTAAALATFLLYTPSELNFHLAVGQTDLPAMVFTALAVFAWVDALRSGAGMRVGALWLLVATTARTEGVLFAMALGVPAALLLKRRRWRAVGMVVPSLFFFLFWNLFYVKVLMGYDAARHFRTTIDLDPARVVEVLRNALTIIFFHGAFDELNWLIPVTLLAWLGGRRWSGEPSPVHQVSGLLLLAMLVCFVFYMPYFYQWDPHLNPLDTMEHTFKRGFFRFIPLLLASFVSAPLILRLLRRCDGPVSETPPALSTERRGKESAR